MSISLRWKFSRVRESDYGRTKPTVEELDQLRALHSARRGKIDAAGQDEIKTEIARIRARLEEIEKVIRAKA